MYIGTLRMVVHSGAPPLRLRFFGANGLLARIDVYDETKHSVTHRLTLPEATMEPQPSGGIPYIRFADLNFDGNQDLMIHAWSGATGNNGWLVWLFDPRSERFVMRPELSNSSNLEPHPQDQTLTTYVTGGMGGAVCGGERLRWENGDLTTVRVVTQDWNEAAKQYVLVIQEPRDGLSLTTVQRQIRTPSSKTVRVEHFRGGRVASIETLEENETPEERKQLAGSPCWEP